MKENISSVPAELFVIADQQAQEYIIEYLQSLQCKYNRCTTCTICTHIAQKQSADICWITPETRYTLESFEILFKKISFALEPETYFFFVIEQTHLLSGACANALLKIVEEPPAGYRFIFTASTLQGVLPTLRSRCRITICASAQSAEIPKLLTYFTQPTNPNAFLKTLTASPVSEVEAMALIEALMQYYTKSLINTTDSALQAYTYQMVTNLQHHAVHGVVPGGAKIFLKDLYLRTTTLRKAYGIN